jgi:hypothetical protein
MSAMEKIFSRSGAFLARELLSPSNGKDSGKQVTPPRSLNHATRSSEETRPPSQDELREYLTRQALQQCGLPGALGVIRYREDERRLQLYMKPQGWSLSQWRDLQKKAGKVKLLLAEGGIEVAEIYCANWSAESSGEESSLQP